MSTSIRKVIGNILYILGIVLLIATLALPIGIGLFVGGEAAAGTGMLGMFTFWPGLILFFMGRALRSPSTLADGSVQPNSSSKKVIKAVLIGVLIILAMLAIANLPFLIL